MSPPDAALQREKWSTTLWELQTTLVRACVLADGLARGSWLQGKSARVRLGTSRRRIESPRGGLSRTFACSGRQRPIICDERFSGRWIASPQQWAGKGLP